MENIKIGRVFQNAQSVSDNIVKSLWRNMTLAITNSDVAFINRLDDVEISELTATCVEAILSSITETAMEESVIRTRFINHGRWLVTVWVQGEEIASWETTDSMLVDDIHEFNGDGDVLSLQKYDSFEELAIDVVDMAFEKKKS